MKSSLPPIPDLPISGTPLSTPGNPPVGRVQKSKRLRTTQWIALGLLVAAGLVNYLDRSTLSIANHSISAELGLSPTQMGLLLSVFSWAYALAQLPIGGILDRFGARVTLGVGLFVWSIAQGCIGFMHSLAAIMGARIALGFGEAPQFPAGAKVVSEWFSVKERGLPSGIFNLSSSLGPAISQPILTGLLLAFGWRHMFVAMGVLGIVVAAVWYAAYRSRRDVHLTNEELVYLDGQIPASDAHQKLTLADWKSLFGMRVTWGITLGYVGIIYMFWLFLTWLPGYLEHDRGLSIAHAGWVASIPFLAGAVGVISGGFFVDFLARHGVSVGASRRIPICLGMLASACFIVPAAFTASTPMAVFCVSGALFSLNVSIAGAWSLVSVAVPSRMVASLGSIQNFGGYFGGAFAPTITGIVVERTHSFSGALLISAAVAVAGALIYFFLARLPKRVG
ncbi:MFS transporter [Paraburkholderia sp. HD33-4]|uniref:MFS transporter n=1 Tax=Paraburkholderia sp. HD33-4 TaxID=2883242 RepID=UPI001F39582B|nr:MFS transporter [Paraburkholderia sp. HD33-4]